jgi:hypothetical protein
MRKGIIKHTHKKGKIKPRSKQKELVKYKRGKTEITGSDSLAIWLMFSDLLPIRFLQIVLGIVLLCFTPNPGTISTILQFLKKLGVLLFFFVVLVACKLFLITHHTSTFYPQYSHLPNCCSVS